MPYNCINKYDLPIGTKLYNIKAHQNPDDVAGLDLGAAITTDECVTSLYGDTRLFFKHQWIEDDVALMPAWTEGYADQCYCNAP